MPLKLSIFNKNYRLNIDFVRIEMSHWTIVTQKYPQLIFIDILHTFLCKMCYFDTFCFLLEGI